jgi:hypothetical protein
MHSASPERGDSISIPSQYPLLCDVDVNGLVSRVILLLVNTFSASSLSTAGCYSSSLPLKFVVFVTVAIARWWQMITEKFSSLWRSCWFGGCDGCVWVAESVLMCLLVVLVVAVAVAVVGAVVPDPWEYIPCSCLHRLLRPVRLPCFPVRGSKLLALVVDTGKAYPPAPSEAVLRIPFSGAATML